MAVASFLFGGVLIPLDDLYYPWTIFYYIMPYLYYVRTAIYENFVHATFATCDVGTRSAICIQEETPGAGVPGIQVLEAFNRINPIAETESSSVRDTLALLAIGFAYKLLYTIGVVIKTRRVANIRTPTVAYSSGEHDKSKSTKSSTGAGDTLIKVDPVEHYFFSLPAEAYEGEVQC
jgi:hypothetical protein